MWYGLKLSFIAQGWGSSFVFLKRLVRPEGLEPPAYWFEANRSIQLSYRRGSGDRDLMISPQGCPHHFAAPSLRRACALVILRYENSGVDS